MSAPPTAASQDVANIIPERTLDPSGDFTTTTNPTQAAVQTLITEIVGEVQTQVGVNVDASLAAYATLVVATGAAAQVELAFTNDLSPDVQAKYTQLQALYESRLARLSRAQTTLDQGGSLGDETLQVNEAVFYVPDTQGNSLAYPMTRWAERF